MKKILIGDKQLKNIISSDLQNFWINWAAYKVLINNNEILKNNEFENELIKNINFLNCLKDELNKNNILNIELTKIFSYIQKNCWKRKMYINSLNGTVRFSPLYFDEKLKQKIINYYNQDIKFSNQKQKKKIIDDYFKTLKQRKQYDDWKQNYFRNINEKIIKNNIEQGIEVLDYFKDEINAVDLQSAKPLRSEYKSNSLKI